MLGFGSGLNWRGHAGTVVSGGGGNSVDTSGGGDPGGGDPGGGDTGGGTGSTGFAATTLPLTPTSHWHPDTATVTLTGGRVTSASDLMGLAGVTEGAPGIGPKEMTDPLGRKFWRFEGDAYLNVATDIALSSRDMTVFMVGRFHRIATKCPIFSLGSVAAGTQSNTAGAAFEASTSSLSVPLLRCFSYPRNTSYPGADTMVAGSQMQVVGMTGRLNSDGGSSLWMNSARVSGTQPYPRVDIPGAEIGRYSHSPGTSGKWGTFDLYEMIVVSSQITDAEGDATVAAFMAHYGIPDIANQLLLEGDSIMQGTDDVIPALSAGMVLTTPGEGHIDADWRVVNMAKSGSQMAELVARRDAVLGWPTLQTTGQNVMVFEVGRNDIATGNQTAAQHYATVVSYLTDPISGGTDNVLAAGWDVRAMANIASSPALMPEITGYRALIRDPAFLTDTGTQSGGAYAGQLSIIDTDLITDSGDTVFATSADAADQTYYAGDSTHPDILGAALRATGGDDPLLGIAAGL